jgi:hypothetical protein
MASAIRQRQNEMDPHGKEEIKMFPIHKIPQN